MFESKKTPGKKFGNGFRAKRYDEMHGKEESPAHEAGESTAFESGEQEGATEKPEQTEQGAEGNMHPVVQAHGPAEEVNIKHDHEGGKHHVSSRHKDGHTHLSEHQTPEEAHEEGGKLSGVSVKKENEDKGEEDGQQGAHSEEDGFEMPPLV